MTATEDVGAPTDARPCAVCGGPVRAFRDGIDCAFCGWAFHLHLGGAMGRACGVTVHASELGLGCCGMIYACDRCAEEHGLEPGARTPRRTVTELH